MEIRSVRVGIVVIKAVHSGFYVAMNRRGRLHGSRVYTVDCRFQERIEENGYNTYASPAGAIMAGPCSWPSMDGGPSARWPDAQAPPVHPLPARAGLLRLRDTAAAQ